MRRPIQLPRAEPRPSPFWHSLLSDLAQTAVSTAISEVGATVRDALQARRDARREEP